ncbi:MAG: VanZ family protein [Flavobacteriales bacterium]
MNLILAVFWTAFIVYGLLSEPSGIPRFPWLAKPGMDKVIHAVLFGVEAGLIALSLPSSGKKLVLYNLLWCFLLGGFLEVAQYYWVDGRNGDVLDLIADMAGAAFAAWFILKIRAK